MNTESAEQLVVLGSHTGFPLYPIEPLTEAQLHAFKF